MKFLYMSGFRDGVGGGPEKRYLNLHNQGIYPVHSYSNVKIQLINYLGRDLYLVDYWRVSRSVIT